MLIIEERGGKKYKRLVLSKMVLNSLATEQERKDYVFKEMRKYGFDPNRPIGLYKGVTQYAWTIEQEV